MAVIAISHGNNAQAITSPMVQIINVHYVVWFVCFSFGRYTCNCPWCWATLQLRLFQRVSWCHIIHVEPFYSHESTKQTEFAGVSIGETCVRSVKATPINSCGGGGIPLPASTQLCAYNWRMGIETEIETAQTCTECSILNGQNIQLPPNCKIHK